MNKNLVKICITGKNPKLFVKRFLINKYMYYELKQENYNKITFKIAYTDYLKLNEISTVYDHAIIKYYGYLKYINFIKQNLSFVISFLISIVFLFIISNICFNIEIVHNNKKIRNLISDELNNNNIKKFSLIPNFSKRKEVIQKIVKENKDDIEWLEIERKGSKLIVKLTERKLNLKKENLNNRHIIAKKSGIIKKIEAESGVIVKKVNDYVKKGDVIVSGDIIKDETIKGQVVSKGVVYAETWYKVNVEYPLYYEEVKYLDEIKNNIIISLFDNSYSLRKNYTDSYLEKKYILIKEKIFPFNIRVEKQRKTKVLIQELTKAEAIKKAEEIAENKINVKLAKDEYVISKKTLNYNINNSKIVVDIFFKVYENITDYENTILNSEVKEVQ